jgi:O-antigen ligase
VSAFAGQSPASDGLAPTRHRLLLAAGFAVAALVASTGAVQALVFAQPSNVKYLVTVAGLALGATLVLSRDPARLVAVLTVLALPISGFETTVSGVAIPLLLPMAVVGLGALAFTRPARWQPTRMAVAAGAALTLLIGPFAIGAHASDPARALGTLIAVAWLVAAVARTGGARTIVWALVASACAQALIGFWEFQTGSQLDLYGGAGSLAFGGDYFFGFDAVNRPTGTFFDPISLGNMLAVALPLAAWLAVRRAAAAVERGLALAAAAVIAIGLLLTLSRMSWIGAGAGMAIAVIMLPGAMRWRAAAAVLTLCVVVAGATTLVPGTALSERAGSILSPTSDQVETARGDELRKQVWRDAVDTWRTAPVLGTGMGDLTPELVRRTPELTLQGHAHSTYLAMLGQAGLAGALALLLVLAATLRASLTARRRDPVLAAAVLGATVAMLVCWLTDYTIRYEPVAGIFGLVFGLAASLDVAAARRGPAWR